MAYKIKTRDEHFQSDGEPKRLLALDGGGVRGILTLGILERIEALLKARHGGNDNFRLCHYFDLIAGTSTGAIIAAALARGMAVGEIIAMYFDLGERVFKKSYLRRGLVRARYDEQELIVILKKVFGEHATLGSPDLKTGLLIVTKRLDSGSPWPLGNNPKGKFYAPGSDPRIVPNKDYPLWKVVRASTAAPQYFEPETIEIIRAPGKKRVSGQFVDGGVSPFNNPALQAFMYATLEGYRVGWHPGAENLLLASVGTGSRDPVVTTSSIAARHGINALLALMDDCGALVETIMQWLSKSPTARPIDLEIGDLGNDLIAPEPLLSYLRYNVQLKKEDLGNLGLASSEKQITALNEMDDPSQMTQLKQIGDLIGLKQVKENHFPELFDLPAA
jgi:hypothetical protein